MEISELNPDQLSDKEIHKLLYTNMDDDVEKGDCIFVFGSRIASKYRLPKALQLYREGRANKILFSGGSVWEGSPHPEAVLLKNEAIKLGIPEKDILVETQSRNTKENVLASLLVLDRYFQLHHINRLLIVTSNYHMRRTFLTLKTYMPSWIEYSFCPAENQSTKKDNWFLSEKGRARATEEAKKIIKYVRWGALMDEEL
ncbi:YdcF family protein [Bacillus niameyensis]|uniref:YdcF family protein n=1 Tax=Bacillus niameyensis TaxID=1522308 RepID=UPI00078436B9|nr:YdcF family protein [Bacillus niameyensis]